jgi:asparagine synthase (glutamine-hydrolysing)
MCGICGAIALDGATGFDRELAERMNSTMVHRGPDSAGVFVEGPVCLAMRRLSIIDLQTGDQPIGNEDGAIQVVQNGEIYNYRELRAELERSGHRFATHSDTEVICHLYEEHGVEFVARLRGMFGIGLWDARTQRLVLARDRYGIKPLYYREGPEFLSFASELKALLADPGFPREIDLAALNAYLTFNWIPAPRTIFAAAKKLPPGCTLVREAGRTQITQYASPRPVSADRLRTEPEEALADELRDRLRDSVRAHLVADVPVGVMLSGGIDSCALAALAAEQLSEPLKTFSIGFKERAFSELELARLIAERYGTDHHELVVEPDAVEILPKLAVSFDEPFADSSALPTYLVSELAASDVKVAFSGEGGDELFGGYNTYVADLLAPRFGRLAGIAQPLLERLPSSQGSLRLDDKLKRFARAARMPVLERHLAWTSVFADEARRELLGPGVDALPSPLEECRAVFDETAGAETLSRLLAVDLTVLMPSDQLTKTDRASMAHSLEARVPFLDQTVVDFAQELPASLKVRGMAKKRLLRRAVAPLLPEQIIRGRKRGFSIPAAAWFRGELQPFLREALSEGRLREQGYFEPRTVTGLIDRHVSGREDLSRQLWGLLMFSLWHDTYATAPAATVAR